MKVCTNREWFEEAKWIAAKLLDKYGDTSPSETVGILCILIATYQEIDRISGFLEAEDGNPLLEEIARSVRTLM